MFDQVELLATAGKSRQVSRLYLADANLSALRFWLRQGHGPAGRSSSKVVSPINLLRRIH
jgi:hypothetical protein